MIYLFTVFGIWATLLYGWVFNIYYLSQAVGFDGAVAVRIAGIFLFPLGALAGWFL